MRYRIKLAALFFSFAISIIAIIKAMPSYVLPGQSIVGVISWSIKHPKFSPLMPSVIRLQTGEPDFQSVTTYDKNTQLTFLVWIRKWRVVKELLDYRSSHERVKFNRDNVRAMDLVKQVYGSDVFKDFEKAQVAYRREGKGLQIIFYRGNLYGYIASYFDSDHTAQFTVTVPSLLNPEIQLEQKRQLLGLFSGNCVLHSIQTRYSFS